MKRYRVTFTLADGLGYYMDIRANSIYDALLNARYFIPMSIDSTVCSVVVAVRP